MHVVGCVSVLQTTEPRVEPPPPIRPGSSIQYQIHPLIHAALTAGFAAGSSKLKASLPSLTAPLGTPERAACDKLAMVLLVYGQGTALEWAHQQLEVSADEAISAAQLSLRDAESFVQRWMSQPNETFQPEPVGSQQCKLGELYANLKRYDIAGNHFR